LISPKCFQHPARSNMIFFNLSMFTSLLVAHTPFTHTRIKSLKNKGKPNGIIITEELREELNAAAATTAQAYATVRSLASGEDIANNPAFGCALEDMLAEKLERHRAGGSSASERDEAQLNAKVLVMQPILRFLQLLCENHNRELQVRLYLRCATFLPNG
jgi:hypothetical protein